MSYIVCSLGGAHIGVRPHDLIQRCHDFQALSFCFAKEDVLESVKKKKREIRKNEITFRGPAHPAIVKTRTSQSARRWPVPSEGSFRPSASGREEVRDIIDGSSVNSNDGGAEMYALLPGASEAVKGEMIPCACTAARTAPRQQLRAPESRPGLTHTDDTRPRLAPILHNPCPQGRERRV